MEISLREPIKMVYQKEKESIRGNVDWSTKDSFIKAKDAVREY